MADDVNPHPPFLQFPVLIKRAFYDRIRSSAVTQYTVSYNHTQKLIEIKEIQLGDSIIFACAENLAFLPKEHRLNYQRQLERIVTRIEEDSTHKRRILHFKH